MQNKGSASRGTSLQVVVSYPYGHRTSRTSHKNHLLKSQFNKQPMTGGTVKSAPGFSPSLDAEFVGVGNDYIKADGDGKHVRLNAHGVLK